MKITERIHRLEIPFQIKISETELLERKVNIYILFGKQITIIDTGIKGSEKIIFDYIIQSGRKVEEIKYVLLTHTHADHMGSVKAIKEYTNCRVGVHAAESEWLLNIDKQYKERPIPNFYDLVEGSCKYDFLLNDNDILDLDEQLKIKVLHTPGHSSGSVSFLLQQDNALFTGDAIPVAGQLPIYDNWKASLASLEKIENLPYARFLLPAWDEPRKNDEVQIAISEGFEVIYQIHSYYLNQMKAMSKNFSIEILAKKAFSQLQFSSENYNPLFIRTLKSHIEIE